jgi:putative ABC transport system permease protein
VAIAESIGEALTSIATNKLRASLTMLGIVVGVAAVITMVALGTGAQRAVEEQLASLGGDVLTVYSGQRRHRGVGSRAPLTSKDSDALIRDSRLLSAVVPVMQRDLQIKLGNKNTNATVLGTTPNYPDVLGFKIRLGRKLGPGDEKARRRVVVVGHGIPAMLEVDGDALAGQTLFIRGVPFEIVGVMAEKGSQGHWRNPDEQIWIPLATAEYRLFGGDQLRSISLKVTDGVRLEQAMVDIERVLRREHRIRPGGNNDFTLLNRQDVLTTQQEASSVFTILLASVAGVSLFVGGIGIMNIMLVAVTERTREIGVRKAMGATPRDILVQFLVEALVLCMAGGVVGVAVGAGAAFALSRVAGWNTLISPMAVAVAFLFSAAVGIFFGLWPARRAARLNPIEALRYE